ncbi:ORF093 myristylated protein [Bovine papular stomatitis virus]|uniref:ORF093 myristylated protein n=1 Tax=Bovine papular stomatitis virus TaxID=129727 RepID=Q6TV95_9POXV|nr:ORF093 myristylated protein [Bovine papular stomatitis virus]AAR98450.1 ORF093 myristylated protein [Bovine papular stomatitis virus]
MGDSVSKVEVIDTPAPGEYALRITHTTGVDTFNFAEESETFSDVRAKEIRPRFCLLPDMDPGQCGRFLSKEVAARARLVQGPPCDSLFFRPGSLLRADYIPDSAKPYLRKGSMCVFKMASGPAPTDAAMARCCTRPTPDCPSVLANGYKTAHCDLVMASRCAVEPDAPECMDWLRTGRYAALDAYAGLCAKHMDARFCSEFARVARPSLFAFGDSALRRYCDAHRSAPECACVTGRALGKYLGPRVCRAHECTDQSRDRKWLFFSQDVQRSRCKYVGCRIDVDSLVMQNSRADMIADCGKAVAAGYADPDPGVRDNAQAFLPAVPPFAVAALAAAVIFYFVAVYSRRSLETKVINVYRR